METLRQVVGVDVAKNELVATLGKMTNDLSINLYAHKVFKNTPGGITALLKWGHQLTDDKVPMHFVMKLQECITKSLHIIWMKTAIK